MLLCYVIHTYTLQTVESALLARDVDSMPDIRALPPDNLTLEKREAQLEADRQYKCQDFGQAESSCYLKCLKGEFQNSNFQ